jgi:hypothetical protein
MYARQIYVEQQGNSTTNEPDELRKANSGRRSAQPVLRSTLPVLRYAFARLSLNAVPGTA